MPPGSAGSVHHLWKGDQPPEGPYPIKDLAYLISLASSTAISYKKQSISYKSYNLQPGLAPGAAARASVGFIRYAFLFL